MKYIAVFLQLAIVVFALLMLPPVESIMLVGVFATLGFYHNLNELKEM